ncbi:MAG: glycosyltransferase family 4 protein, partial [Blastocatellia bacterium]|nr:glycosyltransferase family 4 protein [Blastocatellia bacterium]
DATRKKLRNQYGWKDGCTVVGVVNQISPGKGQKVLIEALSLLKDRWLNLHVVFAGQEHGGSSYTSYLRSLIAEAGLSDRVEFLGYVKNIAELYSAVDIVVIPSENEAFSIVCLEAMASGRVVIASNVGGLAEIIEDGKTGVLFSVGDSKELAEKLDLLLSQPAFADRLVAAAREIIEERFLRRRQIARTEQLYREAIERRCR